VLQALLFGVGAIWVARAVGITVGLVVLPVLFRHLGRAELGIWLLFGQACGLLQLLDFGLKPVLTRRIAMATGAAHDFSGEGAHLVATGRFLSQWLAAGVLVIGLIIGMPLILPLDLATVSPAEAWTAWTLLCLASAVVVWSGCWGSVIAGAGQVGPDVLLLAGGTVVAAVLQACVAASGGGLLPLAAATLASSVGYAWAARTFVHRRLPAAIAAGSRWRRDLVASLRSPALRVWLTMIGGFLILRTDQFVIAYALGSEHIPSYQAAWQIVMTMHGVAVTIAAASSVFVSKLWVAGRMEEIHRLVRTGLHLGLGMFSCAAAVLLTCGDLVFRLWLGPGSFPGYALLAIFCLTFWLETQHVIVALASRATDDEAFAPWALGAGALNLVLSVSLVGPLGLIGVALATMIAQMATNNWYAVYRGSRRLRMGVGGHVRDVLLPALAVLVIAISAAWTSRRLAGGEGVAGLLAAIASVGALWALLAAVCLRSRPARVAA
jgi:O-antigen/teichoic acid export membrane protein